jgi:hypothetical protein
MADFFHRHDHACERPVKGVHGIKGDRGLITELATCHRCGGAGGADQWKRTGWTCYNCGGTGNKGWIDRKVYTAEKIAKLDEAKEKAAAKREAKIKAGRDANIDAFKDEHPDLVAGIAELKDHSHILADFSRTIEQRGSLSDRQIDFGLELIVSVREDIARDKAEAEEKARRIDASSHITGEVGDRLVIKGVVLDTFSGPGGFRGNGWTLTKIDTDDGLVVFWGSLHIAGPDDFEVYAAKGDTVELKATIKEFSERDGEKQTTVNRPHIINIELTGEQQ